MFKEIVAIEDIFSDKVRIKFKKKASCSNCRIESICGRGENSLVIDDDGFSLEKGGNIEIGIDERKSLLATILIFLVPAAVFIAALAAFKAKGEMLSFLLALVVVAIYYVILKLILKKQGKKFNLRILRKV